MCGSQYTNNVYQLFEETALKFPNKVFLFYNSAALTYSEVLQNVHKLTSALRRRGVDSGKTVILQAGNTPYFIYCFFSILQCNAIPVLVNPLARQFEMQYYCDVTQPVCIITSSMMAERLVQYGIIHDSTCVLSTDGNSFTTVESVLKGNDPDAVYHEEKTSAAAIIFTSAMDGYALGAMLTHHGICMSAQSVAMMIPQEAMLSVACLPLFHAFGLTSSLIVPLIKNTPIELVERFTPKKVFRILHNKGLKTFVGVPAMYAILKPLFERANDFTHIRLWVSGGDYLPKDLQVWYAGKGIDIRQGYGLTEASPIVSWNMPHMENRICSIGKPMPYNEVSIVNEDGNTVPPCHHGEIIVRGINVIEKYYNNPQKTKEYIQQGWLYTGDIGYYDNDGYLYISGRKKDMVLKNGYNVYPKEVERILANHPDIQSVQVSGHVRFTGDSTCERLVAEIKAKKNKTLTIEEVKMWCAENISIYKIPDEIIIT